MPTLTEQAVALIAYLDKNTAPQPKANAPPSIAALLTQSRAAHLTYRRSLRHRADGVTLDGNPAQAAESVASAARLRSQAEIQDPTHADSSWADDLAAKFPHAALMDFYKSEVEYYVPSVVAVDNPIQIVDEPPVVTNG